MLEKLNMHTKFWNIIWRCQTIILCLLVMDVVFVTIVSSRQATNNKQKRQAPSRELKYTETENRDVFQPLSEKELKVVRDYLFEDVSLNVRPAKNATFLTTSIYFIEHIFPDKSETLNYLDNGGQQPERWAKAVLLRGDANPPVVEEYKIGPLPTPTNHELIVSMDFDHRPCSGYDFPSIGIFMMEINQNISDLLTESYGSTFFDCGQDCLVYLASPISSLFHNSNKRVYVLMVVRFLTEEEYENVNLSLVMDIAVEDGIVKTGLIEIWYGNQIFTTTEELMDNYRNNRPGFQKFVLPKPDPVSPNVFNMRLRNKENDYLPLDLPKSADYLRPPVTHEPDGKRYEVHNHVVTYMDWQFSYQLRASKGPTVFDVRFQEERIAYELSLQELAVIYSGHKAPTRYLSLFDSCFIMGTGATNLVPGFDCPEHSAFLPIDLLTQGSDEPKHISRAFCLFEINHPVPLHRHRDFSFYGGLSNYALTLRTIIKAGNYDYFLDYNFFQTGGLEVKVHSTGWAQKGQYDESEMGYGWEFPNKLLSPIHHHIFNFKVDVDIHGTSNRFEKLEIGTRTVPNEGSPIFKPNIALMYFNRKLANTEEEGKYDYDFNKPTYLIFHNNDRKQDPDMPKSYRLHAGGVAPLLIPQGESAENSYAFARHQVVVTQRKETEPESASIYQQADGTNPRVNFYDFSDNETIVDQDLVAWVTLGIHHIPHTEDYPVTPTLGTALAFHLTPYNYFPLCPSYQSLDGVYFKHNFGQPNLPPVSVQSVLVNSKTTCPSNAVTFLKKLQLNPELFF